MEKISRFICWFKNDGSIKEEIETYDCEVKKSVILIQRPEHYPKTKHLKKAELNHMSISGDWDSVLAIGWYEVDKIGGLKEIALHGVLDFLTKQSERHERLLNKTNSFISNLTPCTNHTK